MKATKVSKNKKYKHELHAATRVLRPRRLIRAAATNSCKSKEKANQATATSDSTAKTATVESKKKKEWI